MTTFGGMQSNTGSWLSSLTSMVGGIFLTNDETQPVIRGQRSRLACFLINLLRIISADKYYFLSWLYKPKDNSNNLKIILLPKLYYVT